MGRAARWLKGLFGSRKDKTAPSVQTSDLCNNRSSFAKSNSCGSNNPVKQAKTTDSVAWMRSYIAESEKEQNKHAIAVAAATAAAADAAVAAAQAAVAVVRLTSKGRGKLFAGGRERWAALKIQTVFKGFLARKALRALKGLVRIQALVRGYLVRKRAAATLHSMQALIRAQAAVRMQRARRCSVTQESNKLPPDYRARKSTERYDEKASEFYSKRISSSIESSVNGYDDSPKIVEIDTYKPRSRSRRVNAAPPSQHHDYSEDVPYSSPLPCPARLHTPAPDYRNRQDFEWTFHGDECKFPTAHSTPRLAHCLRPHMAPPTPAKSVCGDSFFRQYHNCYPSYMADTQSFRAKLRSHSAPKQRPERLPKKIMSLNEIMASRTSFSSVKMQKHQADEDFHY
uniref:DUF4005 domain-containing protein n=1 Tax=Kalanchoe fedtschenkoi TaxID=63787 RepID=A0A7N0UXN2_KALFE